MLQGRDTNIWFLDRSLQFHHLSSSFTDYYRLLLLHCGLPYWQYKYTDAGIPPYILHWYYTIVPALFVITSHDESTSSNDAVPFQSESVFQRTTSVPYK
jgi:tubulin polyglutamylase complex subunit 2